MSGAASQRFTGWRAFSVYVVEGEGGTIYLSANGTVAHTSDTSPMGRALAQLAAIQMDARSSEEQTQCLPGSGANTTEGNPATDTIYTLPQPSDATELVETPHFPDIVAFLRTLSSYPDEVVATAAIEAAEALTQAQARATAAEGERDQALELWSASSAKWVEALADAQQTITQLTRELELLRGAVETFVVAYRARYGSSYKGIRSNAPMKAEVVVLNSSFLSSLSHQDEQG